MGEAAVKFDQTQATRSRSLVLVVDDEAAICSTLAGVLEDEGFTAVCAHSGDEALEKVEMFRPEVVFLDIWMPGRDGIETLEKIKSVSPRTEVVMMSGHATISNALESSRRGAFDFIEKPLDIESVVLSANRAMERWAKESLALQEATSTHVVATPQDTAKVSTPLLSHIGMTSRKLSGKNLGQRTLKRGTILYGHSLHSGQKSGLVLEPLPPNSGIHFAKIGHARTVPAFVDNVESTGFATTIRSGSAVAATIEHLMAALHAYRISNLLIKCNEEVPIFDGSAAQFCKTIEEVGIEEQPGEWFEIAVDSPMILSGSGLKKPSDIRESETQAKEQIRIEPSDRLRIRYELDYPAPVGRQHYEFTFNGPESFREEIAPARTFGFMKDIERLQKAGLAAGGRLDNFILIGTDRVINTELRFVDELARHKILDILGDVFLLGRPLRATIHARMTGHSDNISLIKALRSQII